MTVQDIITTVDTLQPNKYSTEQKRDWLSQLDGEIFDSIIRKYNRGDSTFTPYTSNTQKVIAPNRYKQMYVLFLKGQIDLANAEPERFNNNMAMYSHLMTEFERAYIRTHAVTKEFKL